MFFTNYVVAFALLTSPPHSLEPPGDTAWMNALRPTLQALAVQMEILDPREVRYVLTRNEDFASDLKLLRRRYHDLADAPSLLDCDRFPERDTITDLLTFNRAYRQHIDGRQMLELARWWELRESMQEADRLYQVWDTLRDARCDYYYVTVRRQALNKLRELVGDQAYFAGTLPPHVPVWRFQSLD